MALMEDKLGMKDSAALQAGVAHLVSDAIPQAISRKVMAHVAPLMYSMLGKTNPALFEEVADFTVQQIRSSATSFEEADYALRKALFEHHKAGQDYISAANALADALIAPAASHPAADYARCLLPAAAAESSSRISCESVNRGSRVGGSLGRAAAPKDEDTAAAASTATTRQPLLARGPAESPASRPASGEGEVSEREQNENGGTDHHYPDGVTLPEVVQLDHAAAAQPPSDAGSTSRAWRVTDEQMEEID